MEPDGSLQVGSAGDKIMAAVKTKHERDAVPIDRPPRYYEVVELHEDAREALDPAKLLGANPTKANRAN